MGLQVFYNCWVFFKFQLRANNFGVIWFGVLWSEEPIYFGSLEIFDGATMHIGTMLQIPNDTFANTFEVVRCENHDLFYDLHHHSLQP